MKIRRFLLILCIASYVFVTSGCSFWRDVGENPYSYCSAPFHAEIEGNINGIPFAAVVEHGSREDTVTYLCPDALAGISLSVTENDATLKRGEERVNVEKEELTGLLSPLEALLSKKEIRRIRRGERETLLTHPDGGILTLSKEGAPLRYDSDFLFFTVTQWKITQSTS